MRFKNYLFKAVSVILTVLICFGSVTGLALAAPETEKESTTAPVTDVPETEDKITAEDIINDIVEIARAEKGKYESNINKFTLWYYGREVDSSWCTIFVSWCAAYAGAIGSAIPRRNTCSSMKRWFERRGEYHPADSGYVPQKGDIAFLNTAADGTDDVHHVEIVTENGFIVKKGVNYIRAIGGNTSDINYNGSEFVTEKTRPVISERAIVVGYANPSYENSVGFIGDLHTSTQQDMSASARYLYSRIIALIYNIEIMWVNFVNLFNA